MYRDIYNHINDSIEDRTIDIINEIFKSSSKYNDLTNQLIEVENQILSYFNDDFKTLFLDYEILLNERDTIKDLTLYRQGVIDGIKIRNLISKDWVSKSIRRPKK